MSEQKDGKGETVESFHDGAHYLKAFLLFAFSPGFQEERYPGCQMPCERESDPHLWL